MDAQGTGYSKGEGRSHLSAVNMDDKPKSKPERTPENKAMIPPENKAKQLRFPTPRKRKPPKKKEL